VRPDDLVRMANQIAHFFSPYPERDAIDGVRDHIEKYWDPSMRRELTVIAEGQTTRASGAPPPVPSASLDPLVVRAVELMRPSAAG
jgi:formate dehydrogenase subunit delta